MCKSKVYRLSCLLLVFLLFFQSFGLGVSASDIDNLIDSNLINWNNIDTQHTKVTQQLGNSGAFYQLTFKPIKVGGTDTWLRVGQIYDLSDLTAGNSYTLKFNLMDFNQITNEGISVSETFFYQGILNYGGQLFIGVGSYSSSTNVVTDYEGYYIQINKDNYLDYFGKNTSFTFELPTLKNACIYIAYYDIVETGNVTSFYFRNFSLVDNEQAKEDGFLSKLFAWFQAKFDSIGESFSNLGNKLTDLKDSFINKITDLKDSFVLKLEELKQGILNLGDIIIEGIQGLFTPDEAYIIQWKANLQQLLQDNLGIIYTCGDLFITVIQEAFEIISDAPDTYEIKIPEVSFEANGTRVPVFTAQSIDFSFMEKPVFRTMYSMYTVALYIFFGGLEVRYALRVKDKVMSN